MRYSVQLRDRIFLKDYGFLSFAKIMSINIGKSLKSKYSEKLFGYAKQSATDAFKNASKRAIQKTLEATSNLIGNQITDKITAVSKKLPQNNSVSNEEKICRERYISREERQRIIDDLRLNLEQETGKKSQRTYNGSNQIRFKTSTIRSSLCYYSDACIYFKETKTFPNTGTAAALDNRNKIVLCRNVFHLLIVYVKQITNM